MAPLLGRARHLDASTPLALTDPSTAHLLQSGEADVFIVPVSSAGLTGRRFYVASVRAGALLLGVEPIEYQGNTWTLTVVGVDADVAEIGPDWIDDLGIDPDLAGGVHHWLSRLAERLETSGPLIAAGDYPAGEQIDLAAGQVLNSRPLLGWFSAGTAGVGIGDVDLPPGLAVPLGGVSFTRVRQAGSGTFLDSARLTTEQRREGLGWGQQALLDALVHQASQRPVAAANRQAARLKQERLAREEALLELESIGRRARPQVVAVADPLLAACQLLGRNQGMRIVAPPDWSQGQNTDPLRSIARASGVRVRAVTLNESWWRLGIEAMIAFRTDRGEPVVLLPRRRGGFDLLDPADGTKIKVGAKVAEGLRPTAYVFYPPLPSEGITIRTLLGSGLRGSRDDLLRTLAFSMIAGVLSLAIPIATGAVLGSLVPQGSSSLIVAAGVGLFFVVFASTGFLLGRSGSLLRLQGRLLTGMQAGLWDRLIALPVEFFRRYSVADLSLRVSGVEMIQQIIASVASQTLLSLVTMAFSLALLFVYDAGLAAIVLVVTLVVVAISATLTWAQITRLRAMYDARGEASAVLLQLVQGIDKVRAAAAENRALDAWSRTFARQASLLLSSQQISAVRTAMYAALPTLLTLTVFTVVGQNPTIMSTAAFLSFITALGQIASATSQLDLSLGYILNIVPIFDRMRPVLEEPVELSEDAVDPGRLVGKVSLNNVTFRYPGMSATVLTDIDLTVEPGEFVGIVGPSGSGKSTLVRLMLGFERPEIGTVTYDSKDLTTLDARAVRSQIGVAMQNASITGGDILSAIRGDWPLTEAQAWAAAEKVGLADDIRALPMGMRTLLGDNAITFSGGQRQRLVLASAIARDPRVVILDEATSALDSVTQAQVAESFGQLQVTRVVVAHRLSTIRNADRVVVLDHGTIVQQGTYDELAEAPGLFASMVRRQTL